MSTREVPLCLICWNKKVHKRLNLWARNCQWVARTNTIRILKTVRDSALICTQTDFSQSNKKFKSRKAYFQHTYRSRNAHCDKAPHSSNSRNFPTHGNSEFLSHPTSGHPAISPRLKSRIWIYRWSGSPRPWIKAETKFIDKKQNLLRPKSQEELASATAEVRAPTGIDPTISELSERVCSASARLQQMLKTPYECQARPVAEPCLAKSILKFGTTTAIARGSISFRFDRARGKSPSSVRWVVRPTATRARETKP